MRAFLGWNEGEKIKYVEGSIEKVLNLVQVDIKFYYYDGASRWS